MKKAEDIFKHEVRLNQSKINRLQTQVAKGIQKALYTMDDLDLYLAEAAGGITDLIFELNNFVGDEYQPDLERTQEELREIQGILKDQQRYLRDTQKEYQRMA